MTISECTCEPTSYLFTIPVLETVGTGEGDPTSLTSNSVLYSFLTFVAKAFQEPEEER